MTDTASLVRKQLEAIRDLAPPACTEESERMQVHQWRSACREMQTLARGALKAIKDAEK